MEKKRLVPVVVVAAVAVAAVSVYRWSHQTDPNTIRVSGNIELTEVNISFKAPGKLVERAFDEGDTVRKGAVVARLDQEQLLGQRDRARAAAESAESARL